ncbi:MAG: four helix bundle protein, partial [Bacteroidaceae bacterium]|jgi:four helix bundle protein|nr:four helix bundle protein [Bacteroidaceae bacterium]
MGRKTIKAKQQFIEYSYGSLMEVLCQLQLANDLGYISEEELNEERVHIEDTARIISGLYSYLETKEKTQKRSEGKV